MRNQAIIAVVFVAMLIGAALNWRTCHIGSAEISGVGWSDGDHILFLKPWMRIPKADCR